MKTVAFPGSPMTARLRDYWALSKPRVTLLVWGTTAAGMALGANLASKSVPLSFILATLLGSWLVIASANVLNQVLEIEPDGKMQRTRQRALPAGRVGETEGLALGVLWAACGLAVLYVLVNPLTAMLGAVSIALYVFAYTPLKKRTHLATAVGAIPGAIPPLAGVAAVTGQVTPLGVMLFAMQFLWQFPHFWAIAWLVREDYAAAGFKMLPFPSADAAATSGACLQYAIATVPFALAPALLLERPWLYGVPALGLSVWFAWASYRFTRTQDTDGARKVLKASIVFLPLLLIAAIIAS